MTYSKSRFGNARNGRPEGFWERELIGPAPALRVVVIATILAVAVTMVILV